MIIFVLFYSDFKIFYIFFFACRLSIRKVALTNNYNLLHCLNLKEGILEVYGWRNNNYTYLSKFNVLQKDMNVIYMVEYDKSDVGSKNTMLIVTEEKICFIRWYYSHEQIHSYDKKTYDIDSDRPTDESNKVVYTCATLTYDQKFLILADSSGKVTVMDTCAFFHPIITYNARVSSLDTYYLENEDAHLICGNENNIIHIWKLDVNKNFSAVT